MDKAFSQKRNKFVNLAVETLQELAKTHGFSKISKESLALIMQRYKEKYNPPRLPKAKRKKNRIGLKIVKED